MRTSNGQTSGLNDNHSEPFSNPENLKLIEEGVIKNLKFQGIKELVKSLKMIHNIALYHTDLCIDTLEKTALHNVKCLWEILDELEEF